MHCYGLVFIRDETRRNKHTDSYLSTKYKFGVNMKI